MSIDDFQLKYDSDPYTMLKVYVTWGLKTTRILQILLDLQKFYSYDARILEKIESRINEVKGNPEISAQ